MNKSALIVALAIVCALMFGCRKDTEQKQLEPVPAKEVREEVHICETKISQTWHEMIPLPEPRGYGCAVQVGNAVYMIGGVTTSDNPTTPKYDPQQFPMPRNTTWRYDLRDGLQGKWYSHQDMLTPVAGAACVARGHKIYVMGGYTGEQETKKNTSLLQIYDTKQDSWSFGPEMTEARVWGAAVAVKDRLCVVGGVGHGYLDSVECYTRGDKKWKLVGKIQAGRYGLGAIVRDSDSDGILVFGGDSWKKDPGPSENPNPQFDLIEDFDLSTGISKVVGHLDQATSAIIGTPWVDWISGSTYLYIQGHLWDATDPTKLVKIGTVPATPDEFDRVYHGFAYPGVAAVPGGVMVVGGGGSGAPTARAMVFCYTKQLL